MPLNWTAKYSLWNLFLSIPKGQGSEQEEQGKKEEERGKKDMEGFSSMLDKVKNNPDVMGKVNSVLEKVKSHPEVMEKVAEVLHLGKHGKSFWSSLSTLQIGKTIR